MKRRAMSPDIWLKLQKMSVERAQQFLAMVDAWNKASPESREKFVNKIDVELKKNLKREARRDAG